MPKVAKTTLFKAVLLISTYKLLITYLFLLIIDTDFK